MGKKLLKQKKNGWKWNRPSIPIYKKMRGLEENDKLQAMEGNRTAIHEQTNEKQNNRKTQAIKFATG